MRAVISAMFVVFAMFSIALSVAFIWLITRLRSPAVKAEFRRATVIQSV
jgi:hypothetical protein